MRLTEFVKHMWPVVQNNEYQHNRHIDLLAERLEMVSSGEIKRLVVNMPPNTTKSLLFNVFWPAWDWLQKPTTEFGCVTSDSQLLPVKDSIYFKRLVSSNKYPVKCDVEKASHITNDCGGSRQARVISHTVGMRSDIIIVDDPHRIDCSEKQMANDIDYFFDSVCTRLKRDGAIVVVMTRAGKNDLTSRLLNEGFRHICLPMEYDPNISREDWRTQPGELLLPDRQEWVDKCKAMCGEHTIATRFQQNP